MQGVLDAGPVAPVPIPAELHTEVKRYIGTVSEHFGVLARVPWMVRMQCRLMRAPVAELHRRMVPLTHLAVSQDNSCHFCYGQTRGMLSILGYSDAQIAALESETVLSAEEQLALAFVRKLSRANPRPDRREIEAMRTAGWSQQAIAELAFVGATAAYANRVCTGLGFQRPPMEAIAQRPVLRLLARPFLGWKMRRPPDEEARPLDAEPGAKVVRLLEGSPCALTLRHMIDDMFASTVLSARAKLLIIAVVGRAVGCEYAARELPPRLATLGLSAGEVEQALGNLDAPGLDRVERLVMPFARDTVRYQPATIQERVRALATTLTPEETLEALGVAALANAFCRLTVLLGCC